MEISARQYGTPDAVAFHRKNPEEKPGQYVPAHKIVLPIITGDPRVLSNKKNCPYPNV
jgi:hypothetical protein